MKVHTRKHYNIMTSCDEKLLPQIPVLVYSISKNIKNAVTDFYLLNKGIEEKSSAMLDNYCKSLKNIIFHDVAVPDAEMYGELAKYGGGWASEAYFSLCAHQILPETEERALYLDAGDVIVIDDISDFYNYDFNGKSLIVHPSRLKVKDNKLVGYEQSDLQETGDVEAGLKGIARGLFNSGSYVMNLKKMREDKLSLNDYFYVVDVLRNVYGQDNHSIYWGDQGLISIAFVGDMRFYNFEKIQNIWYMPYNFCMWYYDRMNVKPDYLPAIIHFAGNHKPWKVKYPIYTERFQRGYSLNSTSDLKLGQAEWYYIWHEYAMTVDRQLEKLGY